MLLFFVLDLILSFTKTIQTESVEEQSMDRVRNSSRDTIIDLSGYDQQQQEQIPRDDVQERQNAIRQLESDTVDVNKTFNDLAKIVHEQEELIDSIEANVETAETNVARGNTQLHKSRHHQASARKKKFFCFLLLIVSILVPTLLFLFY